MTRSEESSRKRKYLDALERVVSTFVQAFAAFWIVTGAIDTETLKAAAVAGALSVAKTIVAWNVGNKETASTLPESADPATPPGQA